MHYGLHGSRHGGTLRIGMHATHTIGCPGASNADAEEAPDKPRETVVADLCPIDDHCQSPTVDPPTTTCMGHANQVGYLYSPTTVGVSTP